MISKIKIKNFQSHTCTRLKFHENINIIIGSSDCGKSSILRAMRWVINNKPNGDSFINYDFDEASVKIWVEENEIERKKGKNTNLYSLNKKELKAFGQEVPEEIKEILNFNDLNLQKQMDKHFLLSDSDGEVARVLNKIINLDMIDISLKNIESFKRSVKRKVDNIKDDISNLELDLENYSWLKEAEKQIEDLNKSINKINKIENDLSILTENLDIYNNCIKQEKKHRKILKSVKEIEDISKKIISIEKNKGFYKDLEDYTNNLRMIENSLNKYLNLTDKLHDINNLLICFPVYSDICEKKDKITELFEIIIIIKEKEKEIKNLKKELNEIMPENCPFCGQIIKRSKL